MVIKQLRKIALLNLFVEICFSTKWDFCKIKKLEFAENNFLFHATNLSLWYLTNLTVTTHMKNILIAVAAFLITATAFAQESESLEETDNQKRLNQFNEVKKHEVSLDVVAAIAGLGINPRYEYVLGRYSGVGVDLNIGILDDDDSFDYYETFSITPYYRQYFFSKEDYGAKGFYAEGFAKVFTFEDSYFEGGDGFGPGRNVTDSYTEAALGVGIGWKWVSDSGFLIDIGFGLGRNLGLASDPQGYDLPEVTGRGGVNFGWRF